ncbi:hypothetical protein YC2023_056734 [Brassica napus]
METFPKTTVDVFALVLESGGSKSHGSVLSKTLNTTRNAKLLALADAGIMMCDHITAVSVLIKAGNLGGVLSKNISNILILEGGSSRLHLLLASLFISTSSISLRAPRAFWQ